jgi:hypothetical protein
MTGPPSVDEAVRNLVALTTCTCDPCWTERGKHDPHSACDYAEDVAVVAAALAPPEPPPAPVLLRCARCNTTSVHPSRPLFWDVDTCLRCRHEETK